ncbi:HSP20-like chaperone [Plasmodium brasilianum]|uniref:HSP20-like chaperone n=1 Tax=Plasmodium brasilianum TaxID=5824 RepID=A0ACB9Y5B6_PLABR|nr:HSP20-like chaperone [Plasmodium brasilianum]
MSSIINYSKFDKIDVSSSDDENKNRKPHVTTLCHNDKVVIGPSGLTILKNNEDQMQNDEVTKVTNESGNERVVNDKPIKSVRKDDAYNGNAIITHTANNNDEGNENKGSLINENLLKNMVINGGVVPYKYIWNQSKHDINGYIVLPLHCKAKSLVVQIYEDKLIIKRNKNEKTLNNKNKSNEINSLDNFEILINKYFSFKINMNEDTQLWEIKNMKINWNSLFHLSNKINNQNANFDFVHNRDDKEETFLYISLKKKNEIENAYIWWASLFKNEEQINISSLPSRISTNKNNNSTSFKNLWNEAHENFKKNIAKKGLPFPVGP